MCLFFSDSIFTINNNSTKDTHWNVKPVGPTYFKSSEANAKITSTNSNIFQFLNSNGIVGAQQTTKVLSTFSSRAPKS